MAFWTSSIKIRLYLDSVKFGMSFFTEFDHVYCKINCLPSPSKLKVDCYVHMPNQHYYPIFYR